MSIPIQCKDRAAYISKALPANVTVQLQNAKQLAVNSLLRPNSFGNVVGIGIGRKVVGGIVTDTRCLRIYVQSKRGLDVLSPAVVVPPSFLDIPTDIIEVGFFGRAGTLGERRDDKPEQGTGPGSSIRLETNTPNVNQGAGGTLGAVVQDDAKNRYILSCNHVLAVNGRVPQDSTTIVTPALSDQPHDIAKPSPFFVPLADGSNSVDCALARAGADVKGDLRSAPDGLAPNSPIGEPDRGQTVKKDGAVTGLTSGTTVDLNADFYIEYSFGTFLFSNQIVIEGANDNFAVAGDSGAVTVNTETNQAVALIFAGAGPFAIACPLTDVFAQLSAKVVSKLKPALT